jgi:hypothetical protein
VALSMRILKSNKYSKHGERQENNVAGSNYAVQKNIRYSCLCSICCDVCHSVMAKCQCVCFLLFCYFYGHIFAP